MTQLLEYEISLDINSGEYGGILSIKTPSKIAYDYTDGSIKINGVTLTFDKGMLDIETIVVITDGKRTDFFKEK